MSTGKVVILSADIVADPAADSGTSANLQRMVI
jgi:hypothetical protein